MVARTVRVVDCRCHGRSSFSALQLIDLSRQTVSLKVDTEGYVTLSIDELWLRCFALGASSTPLEIDAYIHGALRPTRHEFNVIAIALNEYLKDIEVNLFIEYIEEDLDI